MSFVGVVPGADDERAAAVRREHRLLGVDDEVQQHLLELVRIGEDLRQAGGERVDDVDVRDALLVRAQRERLAHDVVEVHHRARGVPLAREGEEVAHDAGGALGLPRGSPRGRAAWSSSNCRGARRSAHVRMVASGLFSSWAMPEIVWPSDAIFSACSSWW